jgi:membrane fusion protein, multidrug efflux system
LRLIDPGNYVQTTNTTGLVVLAEVEPISVIFIIPEDSIQDVWDEVRAGQKLAVSAYNRSDDKLIATGTLESVDNLIDTTTGTVKLRATFPNTDEKLFPNQFVNARLLVRTIYHATKAPVAAIQHGAPGTFVFLIKPDNSVGVQKIQEASPMAIRSRSLLGSSRAIRSWWTAQTGCGTDQRSGSSRMGTTRREM